MDERDSMPILEPQVNKLLAKTTIKRVGYKKILSGSLFQMKKKKGTIKSVNLDLFFRSTQSRLEICFSVHA